MSLFHFSPSYLWSSAPFWLLFKTILQRSEDTSFFWSLTRLISGNCSSQTLLSDRLNSWNATKTFWSSSQYSKLQGIYIKIKKILEVANRNYDTVLYLLKCKITIKVITWTRLLKRDVWKRQFRISFHSYIHPVYYFKKPIQEYYVKTAKKVFK